MSREDAPYMLPKQRRQHAVSMATEISSKEIDIEAVKRELLTPWPRPEVGERVFLRALKAIVQLEQQVIELKAARRALEEKT
jgi:hypothetical protein